MIEFSELSGGCHVHLKYKINYKKNIYLGQFSVSFFGGVLKGYFYKMITSQNVSSEAQVKNFFTS